MAYLNLGNMTIELANLTSKIPFLSRLADQLNKLSLNASVLQRGSAVHIVPKDDNTSYWVAFGGMDYGNGIGSPACVYMASLDSLGNLEMIEGQKFCDPGNSYPTVLDGTLVFVTATFRVSSTVKAVSVD